MKNIDRNIAAALAASVITSLVSFVSIPVYVRFLGVEGYGLVGFLATLQAVVQILDFGISTTINREIARASASGTLRAALGVIRAAAAVYWAIACLIAFVLLVAAPLVARTWLKGDGHSEATLTVAVATMGFVIAARWPAQLYQSCLMGAQRIVVSSLLSLAYAITANVGAIVVLAIFASTIHAFLAWQVAVALLYVLLLRWVMRKSIGRNAEKANLEGLSRLMKFSLGVSVVAATGIALGQADKIAVSRAVDLNEFGQYMLSVTAASLLYLIAAPVFNVIYPRLSELVRRKDEAMLSGTYHLSTQLMACLLFPCALFLAVCAGPLVELWTGNPAVATAVDELLPMMAVGVALHGVMHMPYALQLANGNTRLPLIINAALLVVVLPLAWLLAGGLGARGGALAWLAFQVLYLVVGSWVTHRSLMRGAVWRWLFLDVGVPALIAAAMAVAVLLSFRALGLQRDGQLLAGTMAMALAFMLSVAASPALRTAGFSRWKRIAAGAH